ncbi:flagellar biosynthetic protein FliR [Rubellimicrobium aerolatum]|uniref:Flagellar biosynthetic protein FliR n=1 Tax=Rubellimicrobium aerolatum TaxID=490979 RepID=A0ABW0S9W7_9RHOB|nr:flagellar biosynthetic protein FliR [Rubellimicrobium aerolatum]MBP1805076.1 flagellar biosynthetic protein FliR [Rubellimicrobium aerolatum]
MSPELLDTLGPLLGWTRAGLWQAFVVFLRVGAMLAAVPLFGEATIPMRVRLGLGLAFTLVVLPTQAATLPSAGSPARLLLLVLGEAAIGLAFGLMLRLFVLALQTAGAMAAQSTSLSQLFGSGPGGEPSPAMTHLLVIGGLALAAILGLHVQVAAYMVQSYELVPAGAALDPGMLLEAGLGEVGRSFALAFSLAAPFVTAALLYNVAMGVINRAMPQLSITFIGAPALTAGGLLLFLVAAPVMLAVWAEAFGAFMGDPFGGSP